MPTPTNIYPALLGMFALSTTDFGMASDVLVKTFSNPTVVLIIVSMFFMPVIMDCGLGEYLFAKILSSKLFSGKPWLIVFTLQTGMMLLGFIINPLLILILGYTLFGKLYKIAGYTKKDLFPAFLNMGMLLNCYIVSMHFPWSGMSLISMGAIQSATGLIWPFTPYICAVIPFIFICCSGWALVMRIFPQVDASKLAAVNITTLITSGDKMSKRQKAALITTLIYIISSVFVAMYGNANGTEIQQLLNKIGIYGVIILTVALSAVIPVDGEPLLSIPSATKQFPWEMVVLFGSAICVSSTLVSSEGGIATFLSAIMAPFLMKFGGVGFLIAVVVVMIILTNLLNNTAVIAAVAAMIAGMFVNGMIDETTMYIGCMLAAVIGNVGVLHPGSSASAPLFFGQKIVSTKTGYIASVTACVYVCLVAVIVLIPLARLFYY